MPTVGRLDSDRLEQIADLAKEYAELEQCDEVTPDSKSRQLRICDICVTFNPLEMCYFCQQVVSHYPRGA